MPDTLTVVARLTATEGKADLVQAEMTALVQDTRKEKGCIRYVLNRGVDDPNVFVFVEEWRSRALWEDHMNGPVLSGFRDRIGDDWIASSEVHALTVIA